MSELKFMLEKNASYPSTACQSQTAMDQYWMQQAIALAQSSIYRTKPNPNVGCVIVKDGKVIGRGYHPQAGQSHAEVFALAEAAAQAQGATAYVTLEPCAHFGRTPPCANALVQAQVARVVVACLDPNPLVAGQGVARIQQAGIDVDVGVCEAEAAALNRGFLKAMAQGMPYVRLKIASSLDGRTAMASGESKWITSDQARQDVQHWRALSAAVITGIDTVLADDCLLNVRQLSGVALQDVIQPWRIILDRQGRLPLSADILNQPDTVMVMGPYRQALADLGVKQLPILALDALLKHLCREYQIYDVLVEAGATLSTAFLQQRCVDELISYVAPCLLGQSAQAMFGAHFNLLAEKLAFKLEDAVQIGGDLRLRLIPVQESV